MRIQDTFHPDGISYESGDELSETESDHRSSQEKLNDNRSTSPLSKDIFGNKSIKIFQNNRIFYLFFLFEDNRTESKKYSSNVPFAHSNTNVRGFISWEDIGSYDIGCARISGPLSI